MGLTAPQRTLVLITLSYLILAILYAVLTPSWQAPDEPAHYNYVRYVAEEGGFPTLHYGDYPHAYLDEVKSRRFPPDLSIAPIRYEGHQPPLYYALAAPIYSLSGGDLTALRLFSVALGAVVVLAAHAIVRSAFPSRPRLALATAAFVAFLPQHLVTVSQCGNDVLAEVLLALVFLELVRWLRDERRPGSSRSVRYWRLGALVGLSLLAKTTAYIAVPLVAAVAVWHWRTRLARPKEILAQGGAIVLPAVLAAGPWFARNIAVYGWPDFLGLIRHDQIVVDQLRTWDYLQQVGWSSYLTRAAETTFRSFWGVFGWLGAFMDGRVYLALALFSGVALAGSLWRFAEDWSTLSAGTRRILRLLAGSSALTLAAYIWYNLQFVQHQGRYLFTALIPIAFVCAAGWEGALATWRSRKLAAALVAMAFLLVAGSLAQGSDLPAWLLALSALLAAVLAVRPALPARWEGLLFAAPFALLPGVSLYGLFGVVIPLLS